MSYMVYCYHIAITSGDKATTRSRSFWTCPRCPRGSESRCVILQTRSVATGGFGKVMSAACRLLGVAMCLLFPTDRTARMRGLPAWILALRLIAAHLQSPEGHVA
jgi:hypothetical protein